MDGGRNHYLAPEKIWTLQKINVKVFVEQPDKVALTDFIEIFHSWIQATDGDYHDVADYSHMQVGTGIVLVANDANVSIDESGARRGLLLSHKAPLAGSNQDKICTVIRSALENCRKLEAEPALRGKLRFGASEVLVSVNDRLVAENSQQAFDALKGDVEAVARELFGGAAVSVERDGEARRQLSRGFVPGGLALARRPAHVRGGIQRLEERLQVRCLG